MVEQQDEVMDCPNDMFLSLGLDEWWKKVVCMCMDGAATNMGVQRSCPTMYRTTHALAYCSPAAAATAAATATATAAAAAAATAAAATAAATV